MALQYSVTVRNARLDVIESTIGTTPVLQLRTGAPPANCAAANSGTLLASMTLPSDWMAAASAGAKALSGTWEDASANADGVPGHFRIFESTATTCHAQGTVTETGDGGDMTVDLPLISTGDTVVVTAFTIHTGNS